MDNQFKVHHGMFHAVMSLDVAQDDLYRRHQKVAELLSLDPAAQRDYQFAVMGSQVYLRSPVPRGDVSKWREMPMPEAGRAYRLGGTIWIDASRLAPAKRAIWRTPQFMASEVERMLRQAGQVENVEVSPQSGVPLSKPGCRPITVTPIVFTASLAITDYVSEANAIRIAQQGIGRGKGFGFGCVFFQG